MPGKPLAEIAGRPMIEHVYRRAIEAAGVDRVIVATDHERIVEVVRQFGGEAMMTGDCATGTDRVAEVARRIVDAEIIINVQGDEPLIPPAMIEAVIAPFKKNPDVEMTSLKRAFREDEDPRAPSIVKVVTDLNDNALYFSRSPIPYPRNADGLKYFAHVGIYGFRRETLFRFSGLPQSRLEIAEGLEQLRMIENGIKINVPFTEHFSIGVDTPDDLEKVRLIIESEKRR